MKQTVISTPKLRHITKHRWEQLKWPPKLAKFFTFQTWYEYGPNRTPYPISGYVFRLPFMFVTEIKPHFIYKIPVIYPEVESRLSEIEKEMETYGGWKRLGHVLGWRNHKDDWDLCLDQKKELKRVTKKELKECLND